MEERRTRSWSTNKLLEERSTRLCSNRRVKKTQTEYRLYGWSYKIGGVLFGRSANERSTTWRGDWLINSYAKMQANNLTTYIVLWTLLYQTFLVITPRYTGVLGKGWIECFSASKVSFLGSKVALCNSFPVSLRVAVEGYLTSSPQNSICPFNSSHSNNS